MVSFSDPETGIENSDAEIRDGVWSDSTKAAGADIDAAISSRAVPSDSTRWEAKTPVVDELPQSNFIEDRDIFNETQTFTITIWNAPGSGILCDYEVELFAKAGDFRGLDSEAPGTVEHLEVQLVLDGTVEATHVISTGSTAGTIVSGSTKWKLPLGGMSYNSFAFKASATFSEDGDNTAYMDLKGELRDGGTNTPVITAIQD